MNRHSAIRTDDLPSDVIARARQLQQETVARLVTQGVSQVRATIRRILHLVDDRSVGTPTSR